MKNEEVYYILFFICVVGLLIFLFYYNQQQQTTQTMQTMLPRYIQPQPRQQSIHQYHTQEHQQMNKKTKTNNMDMDYTYNIENIDIRKDNLSEKDKDNKLGVANAANSKYEPELDEVFGATLRGSGNHSNEPDEMFNYCIKPNKSDLPIVNPPLQLLLNNAPLRLSERHSMERHSM
jgi:hypothetical protein